MKRLFVCPRSVWLENFHLFDKRGSHYIDLSKELIVVAGDFDNEGSELAWLSKAEVAALPDPVFEGTITLADHEADQKTNFTKDHVDALQAIGITDKDTILDVSDKTEAIDPLVCVKR